MRFECLMINCLTNIVGHIFAANVAEVAEGAKSQGDELVVKGVEFAQGRRMEEMPKQGEFVFKGAGAGN